MCCPIPACVAWLVCNLVCRLLRGHVRYPAIADLHEARSPAPNKKTPRYVGARGWKGDGGPANPPQYHEGEGKAGAIWRDRPFAQCEFVPSFCESRPTGLRIPCNAASCLIPHIGNSRRIGKLGSHYPRPPLHPSPGGKGWRESYRTSFLAGDLTLDS